MICRLFESLLSDEDITVLRKRNSRRRFDLSMIHSVAARCSYSFPQVLICTASQKGGPLSYNVLADMPIFLDRKCGELESLQKIKESWKRTLQGKAGRSFPLA